MPRPKNSKNKIRPLRPFNPSGDFNAQEAREQNMIGKRLADARKRAHLTQPDVVNRLSLGLGSLNQAVSIRRSNSAVIGFAEEGGSRFRRHYWRWECDHHPENA